MAKIGGGVAVLASRLEDAAKEPASRGPARRAIPNGRDKVGGCRRRAERGGERCDRGEELRDSRHRTGRASNQNVSG